MDTSPAGFPVPHKKLTTDIKKIKTDLVICRYEDHFLVIVTQLGSMGTLLQARKEEGVSVQPTFNVSVIFGKRDECCWLVYVTGAFSWSEGPFCGYNQGHSLCSDRKSNVVIFLIDGTSYLQQFHHFSLNCGTA
uniref:Proteasome assembly chaperone 3 n=1 Tax=Chenopodium quinoa TaxID=63459 RepID=A0A803MJ88_CHEQI